MKRLTIIMATFAALTLLMPQSGLAATAHNQLGIYSDTIGSPGAANYVATPNVPFTAYLVVTNPVNDSFDGGTDTARPITSISGFDCTVEMPAGVSVLATTMPPQSIVVLGGPEYAAGWATGVPVVNNAAVLCTWTLMVSDTNQYDVTLGVIRMASIDGHMSIIDTDDPQNGLSPVFASTNDFGVPVFSINGTAAVADSPATWGDVKAIFR